jgi:GAF domain-containing protein
VEPIPPNEEERLAAVRRYDILDTPPDGAFDRITTLAARLFDVPISIVSIVDTDRIWFKSHFGLDVEEIAREPGLCASAICQEEPWLVTNAEVDVRTIDNPLVAGELGLRFYLGVPLLTADGFNLGTLNVIDVAPRVATADEVATLKDLGAIVVDELELRLDARRKLEERRQRALELNDGVVQGLALAELALQSGDAAKAHTAVSETLRSVQSIVGELLDAAGDQGKLRPGDLVRSTPASVGGQPE